MSDDKILNFDPNDLTIGQVEFLTEYTGRTIGELIQVIESKQIRGRDLTAVVAVAYNPGDPEAALDEVRGLKASDIDVNFKEGDADSDN